MLFNQINFVATFIEKGLQIQLTLEGLKLAAAIGTPRTVKATNQRPPRRMKKDPGLSSPHEYKGPSFRDEYSFTYQRSWWWDHWSKRPKRLQLTSTESIWLVWTYRPLLERDLNFQARIPAPTRDSACAPICLIFQCPDGNPKFPTFVILNGPWAEGAASNRDLSYTRDWRTVDI